MTFHEIVDKVKKEFGSADVSNYEDHLAIQINVTGEGSGIFYVEINDGKLAVEPYSYDDNNAVFTASGDDIIDILSGNLSEQEAYESGKLLISGDMAKAFSIQPVIENNKKSAKTSRKKAAPKTAAVKEEIKEEVKKTAAAVKSAAKTAAKATTKAAAKTTAKATAAVASKAESKTASKTVKESTTKPSAAKTTKSVSKKG
ncbi:SCP2 sterol-binding domain-containing protein [Porcipelethomonas sp.]|uniref:SCP2 sterol-binding domain-containing protein n=1 Tax=Porcipelethomonas sp. TaxID=2981675 RepID=UPI003EFAD7BB